ncbi:hypothetical protein IW262DRAFT_1498530 [Armillaria fumosa]|nr:hypothetical protein IW262DRAFT_1498530 [Armillaria fumosa]
MSSSSSSEAELRASLNASLNSFLLEFYVHGTSSNFCIYTGIYAISIRVLATNATSRTRLCMCYVSTILYILCTVQFAAFWVELRNTFVYGTSFQSQYVLMLDGAPEYLKILRTVYIFEYRHRGLYHRAFLLLILKIIFTFTIKIWRCWVVWEHNWRIAALPIILVASGIFCGIEVDIHQYKMSFIDNVQRRWAVATITMTLAVNVICTVLIVARIVSVTRKQKGFFGCIRDYRGIIEVLVESAALYTLSYMGLLVLYPLNGAEYLYAEMLVYPITGIAPTLIMARVASGQTCPEGSMHGTQSSLHFKKATSVGSTTITIGGLEEDMTDPGEYSRAAGPETYRIIEEV